MGLEFGHYLLSSHSPMALNAGPAGPIWILGRRLSGDDLEVVRALIAQDP
jgi:hypothetical protein